MIFGGNIFGEVYDCIFSIYIGNQLVQQNHIQAPRMMIEQQVIGVLQQMGEVKGRQPMKFEVTREEVIWDEWEKRGRTISHKMEFWNYEPEGV